MLCETDLSALKGIKATMRDTKVVNRGFGELLLLDSLGRLVSKDYPRRVACHEAGHFLVAYLLGVLPKVLF